MKRAFFPVLLIGGLVYAQTSGDNSVVAGLAKADSAIPLHFTAGVMGIIVFGVELAMRFFPTVKPRSLFILVGQGCALVGSIFTKISGLLDGIVQNLKPDA